MHAHVFCASTYGVDAHIIDVEVHSRPFSVPSYNLVGLPDRAISESYVRIDTAIRSTGYSLPEGRKTVSLAPADLPKEGSAFDLPIAVGLLAVSGLVDRKVLAESIILGELALDGQLRAVKGILPVVVEARQRGFKHVVLPKANGSEAAVVDGIEVFALNSLQEVLAWLNTPSAFEPVRVDLAQMFAETEPGGELDFCDVRGQEGVKRALEVAASGGHNIVLVGPPGSGKTMLARRIPGILPPMTLDEALETTKIHSVTGLLTGGKGLVTSRPFRSPHHTVSDVALVGGGSIPMPGEISLAHNGVLFLDELPEFKRSALEVLRQPLEDGYVGISRARMSVTYPSKIMLVASMNPSPWGDWKNENQNDEETVKAIRKYVGRISGPLLDRIDLHIEVDKVSFDELSVHRPAETSAAIRRRVMQARTWQERRFMGMPGIYCNAQMHTRLVRRMCRLDDAGAALLRQAMAQLNLSARAYDRILKVSRSIADLDQSDAIRPVHVAEAIQYRSLDRAGWKAGAR